MIRTWPGQTKEEWLKEYERNKNLTPEERDKELDDYLKQNSIRFNAYKQNKQEVSQSVSQNPFENCDHPNSLENSEATILWIVAMAIGTLFKGNWIIWIVATIIWRRYMTRHKRKK